MSNKIQDYIPPIEGIKIEIDLPAEHQATIRTALARVNELTQRASASNPVSLAQFAKDAFQQHARGEITLPQAVAISSLAGHSDSQRREISERLVAAILVEENTARAAASPAIIAAFTLRTDELRRRVAALETSEQESADVCGIPFEPSETCRRLRATFEHSLERLRALRDRGSLPSKAELRSLAE
ncbi:MAG: hypothetical protein ACOVS5_08945 [Oligoflexus sp.]